MEFRHRGLAAPEVGINEISLQDLGQHIRAILVARGNRIDAASQSKKPKLGIGRRFEFFIAYDIDSRRMIDGLQRDAIHERYFAQLFRHPDLVRAILLLHGIAWNGYILLVIGWKKLAVARTGTQGRNAQNISDEAESCTVPRVDHGAGAR